MCIRKDMYTMESCHQIRMGAPSEFFVKRALNYLCQANCRYDIQFGLTYPLLEELVEGNLDAVLATKKYEVDGVNYLKIEEEKFVIVAPNSFEAIPASNRKAWLEQQNWISYGRELPIIRRIWKQHFNERAEMEPFHVIPDLRGILKGIEAGMGMSVLPTYLIEQSVAEKKCQVLFLDLAVTNQIYLAYRNAEVVKPIVQACDEKVALLVY